MGRQVATSCKESEEWAEKALFQSSTHRTAGISLSDALNRKVGPSQASTLNRGAGSISDAALRRKTWLTFIVLIAAMAALSARIQASDPPAGALPSIQSRFGLDYIFPLQQEYHDEKWAKIFGASGFGWVNFAEISWIKIERRPPVKGVHHYDWNELDRAVTMWQRRNFQIAMSLRMLNGWFAGPVRYNPKGIPIAQAYITNSDRLPAENHMEDYREWITALVERYDGDGADDMEGLRYPVLHYQVGNEYSNPMFWTGTLDDYAELLKETRKAARKASPNVRIISNGIRWNDLFHDDSDGTGFDRRFSEFLKGLPSDEYRSVWRRARELQERTIALADDYDILDAGGNGPYPTVSAGYFNWVRKELSKTGKKRVIWDMEARSEPYLVYSPITCFHRSLQVPKGPEILKALKNKSSPLHDRAEKWYRAEQARTAVKVFVTRFASGFEKVFMGMPNDWDRMMARFTTPNPFLGLTDSEGRPWPAYHAIRLLIRKIDGFSTAEKVQAGENLQLYRFTFSGKPRPVWVAWLDDGIVRGPEDRPCKSKVKLDAAGGPVSVTSIPTGMAEAGAREIRSDSAPIMEIDDTPVILDGNTGPADN